MPPTPHSHTIVVRVVDCPLVHSFEKSPCEVSRLRPNQRFRKCFDRIRQVINGRYSVVDKALVSRNIASITSDTNSFPVPSQSVGCPVKMS